MYANVDNSLCSKLNELETYLSTHQTDVVCITEAKPKHGALPQISSLNIEGFTLYTSDFRAKDSRGVCIYVNSNISATEHTDEVTSKYKDAVWISIQAGANKILLGTIYRSGTHTTAIKYDDDLHQVITHISNYKQFTHTIITGDFNHGHITWNSEGIEVVSNRHDDDFVECFRDSYLYQHVTKPTRPRHKP